MKDLLQQAKKASFAFGATDIALRRAVLHTLAKLLREDMEIILEENKKDLDQMDKNDPLYDRMLLTPKRLENIAQACNDIAKQEDILGKVLEEKKGNYLNLIIKHLGKKFLEIR